MLEGRRVWDEYIEGMRGKYKSAILSVVLMHKVYKDNIAKGTEECLEVRGKLQVGGAIIAPIFNKACIIDRNIHTGYNEIHSYGKLVE